MICICLQIDVLNQDDIKSEEAKAVSTMFLVCVRMCVCECVCVCVRV